MGQNDLRCHFLRWGCIENFIYFENSPGKSGHFYIYVIPKHIGKLDKKFRQSYELFINLGNFSW